MTNITKEVFDNLEQKIDAEAARKRRGQRFPNACHAEGVIMPTN